MQADLARRRLPESLAAAVLEFCETALALVEWRRKEWPDRIADSNLDKCTQQSKIKSKVKEKVKEAEAIVMWFV